VRLDRWLWAARFYKTRSQAASAIEGGKVRLGDTRPKTAAAVRVGDIVRIRSGPIERTVVVTGLAEKRGKVAEAAALYNETAESRQRRREREAQLKLMPETSFRGKGRPTKRERREIDRLRDPWPE
jgi:ribosome-associated heat shock protein Hsp15